MATSLTGRRVVVTRSSEDNGPLATSLRSLGAEVIEVPLVKVCAPADGGRALQAAARRLTDYRYVTLTSANGVRAMVAALDGQPWPAGVVVIPVGPVTATIARDAGMSVGPVPSSATVADLVAEFPVWSGSGNRRVLAPLAELAGDTLTMGLAEKGYSVDRCEAYRTVTPEPGDLVDGLTALGDGADAVLFFSPSAVDRFVDLGHSSVGLAVCIGPSTASRAAASRGRWQVVVADPHTEAGVVHALLEVLGSA